MLSMWPKQKDPLKYWPRLPAEPRSGQTYWTHKELEQNVKKAQGESSHRSQYLNGNRQSVARAELSINQCASRLGHDPFIHSAFRAIHSLSVSVVLTFT